MKWKPFKDCIRLMSPFGRRLAEVSRSPGSDLYRGIVWTRSSGTCFLDGAPLDEVKEWCVNTHRSNGR